MQTCTQATSAGRYVQIGLHADRTETLGENAEEAVNSSASQRRHPDSRQGSAIDVIHARDEFRNPVHLVVYQYLRKIIRTYFLEYGLDIRHPLITFRIGRIDYVQQQVRVAGLGEGRTECRDQIMWQVADETHRICQQDRAAVQSIETTQGWIKRGEQLVRRIHGCAGHRVEQGRLAGIRIANQSHNRQRIALARSTRLGALRLQLFHALLQLPDAITEQATVKLQLGLAGTPQADRTTALAFKVGPAAHQARRHVLELGQLDLQLAFVRAGTLREDVQNQASAVDDTTLGQFLKIALLHRTQHMVDQDQVGIKRMAVLAKFLGLAGTDEIARIGTFDSRRKSADHARARRSRELGEFFRRYRVTLAWRMRQQEQRTLTLF